MKETSRIIKSKKPKAAFSDDLKLIASKLDEFSKTISEKEKEALHGALMQPHQTLRGSITALDPIKEPNQVFDPARPSTAARLVALALLAQRRYPLARIPRFYGSGVYALYYIGKHPAYRAISRTENPIYIGKADPISGEADTARDQGERLSSRLRDHRKSIMRVQEYAEAQSVTNYLRIQDFEYRRLVVASNTQTASEEHLMRIFAPIWNERFRVCWGISKHGDAAKTRANKRSPWDTLHPGRAWALDSKLEDKKSLAQIRTDIIDHISRHPPFKTEDKLISHFLEEFVQTISEDSIEETLKIDAKEAHSES